MRKSLFNPYQMRHFDISFGFNSGGRYRVEAETFEEAEQKLYDLYDASELIAV